MDSASCCAPRRRSAMTGPWEQRRLRLASRAASASAWPVRAAQGVRLLAGRLLPRLVAERARRSGLELRALLARCSGSASSRPWRGARARSLFGSALRRRRGCRGLREGGRAGAAAPGSSCQPSAFRHLAYGRRALPPRSLRHGLHSSNSRLTASRLPRRRVPIDRGLFKSCGRACARCGRAAGACASRDLLGERAQGTASAWRRLSVSRLSSSSLAPRSSACLSASSAARSAFSASDMVPSSINTAISHR